MLSFYFWGIGWGFYNHSVLKIVYEFFSRGIEELYGGVFLAKDSKTTTAKHHAIGWLVVKRTQRRKKNWFGVVYTKFGEIILSID
jgi:hypothetical protein